MVRIRLRRVGARNQPSYRIVAADKESPRDGRFIENLGFYNPRTEPSTVKIDEARLFHWLKHGAQPSDAVRRALKPHGTWDRWERYKGGEDIEALLKEAEEAFPDVDPRTRRDELAQERAAKKKPEKREEVAAEAPIETEPPEEEEPQAETEAEEISPPPSDEEAKEEIEEEEESVEPSAKEVSAEDSEEESTEQTPEEEPAEATSVEDTTETEVEAEEEVEAEAEIEEAESETSDDEED
jgi:small subunit ribosomal protein S16